MDINHIIQLVAMVAIPLIFAITVHEAAHGYVAKMRGDMTAYNLGRVTLNPIKHIDPIGTIVLPIGMLIFTGFVIGWAKPVPVNFAALKKPRSDMAWVALAGPMANLIMAIGWFLVWKYIPHYGIDTMAHYGVVINLILMVLNLLPIPPLDGSRIVSALLPLKAAIQYNSIERFGMIILIVLLLIPVGNGGSLLFAIMNPFIQFFYRAIATIF